MRFFYSIALCLLISVLSTATENERADQQGFLVYDRNCFNIVDTSAYLEYPMAGGEPDSKHGRIVGQRVTLIINPKTNKPICDGHYEVRKIK